MADQDLPSLLNVDHQSPVTMPTSNPAMFYDRNLRIEERFMPFKKRCFATLDNQETQEDAVIKSKKKKRKMPIKMDNGPVVNDDSTVRLKRFITGEMYGLAMKLLIQKTLYESDMNTTQNRLNIPIKQLETRPHEFLTADEMRIIDESKEGIEVGVVGPTPTMQMYKRPLWLKKWHMKHTDNYVLKTNWNEFVADNKVVLKTYTMIQVWSFRKDGKLCFAIVPVTRPESRC